MQQACTPVSMGLKPHSVCARGCHAVDADAVGRQLAGRLFASAFNRSGMYIPLCAAMAGPQKVNTLPALL